ncbi:MAG: hypothetical protein EBS98_01980 [Chitinophagia bacterium]|nr:hypothetical protein [Chitinophagia bacterium]
MNINNPIYENTTINLAVTTKFNIDGTEDASIAMRAIPTVIQDGIVVTKDSDAKSYYRGSINEISDQLELSKIQSLIDAIKGLIQE